MPGIPRVPKGPTAVAFALFKVWSALPPAQRQKLLAAARDHGPKLASKASATVIRTARRRP